MIDLYEAVMSAHKQSLHGTLKLNPTDAQAFYDGTRSLPKGLKNFTIHSDPSIEKGVVKFSINSNHGSILV